MEQEHPNRFFVPFPAAYFPHSSTQSLSETEVSELERCHYNNMNKNNQKNVQKIGQDYERVSLTDDEV